MGFNLSRVYKNWVLKPYCLIIVRGYNKKVLNE